MKRTWTLTACLACVMLAGLGPAPTVHTAMTEAIAPASTALWDVAIRALGENGTPDASQLTEADWAALDAEAQKMKAGADSLAAQAHVVAAAPGVKLQDQGADGGSSAEDVQAFIDADPAGFAEHLKQLSAASDTFSAAARSKDAAGLLQAADTLEGVCKSCHTGFWYPRETKAN